MCKENKEFFTILFLFLVFCFVVGVLRAEEQSPWYLISETEVRSIEQYKANKEKETQSLLSQVQILNMRSARLEADSGSLNNQLSQAREQNRKSEKLFNEYVQDQLILISSKNGEIAYLKQEAAAERLEKEKARGTSRTRLIVIIALAGSWALFLAYKAYRFFRPGILR